MNPNDDSLQATATITTTIPLIAMYPNDDSLQATAGVVAGGGST